MAQSYINMEKVRRFLAAFGTLWNGVTLILSFCFKVFLPAFSLIQFNTLFSNIVSVFFSKFEENLM